LTDGDLHAELCTWINVCMAGGFQRGSVQKDIPRTVGEFNEPEALCRVEPFDYAVDCRPPWGHILSTRVLGRQLRTRALPARFRVIIVVEVASSATPISSLVSHHRPVRITVRAETNKREGLISQGS
jgi:hypothetical protein